ncbi:hypothetical protein PRUPE_2G279000 [Prunus persica]|uniref:Uncharacterized protein n=1 Tax=Prunus persica TaxID=3760 RepID=A0A251QMM3_PRUPE|nr:hypothetical protein PRUPE_2G279000 [Prunus persica]
MIMVKLWRCPPTERLGIELLCGRLMMQSPRSVLNIPSMAITNSASVSLKILIDTKSHKVLFAEASKEVVDFLFSFLSLHVATITRLLLN